MQNGTYGICDITGLYTMMPFMQEATELLHEDAYADGAKTSFIYFDVANFKGLNQKHGFQQGNIFLRHMADVLRKVFKGDILARFNDDHFVIATRKKDINRLIRKVQEDIYEKSTIMRMEIKAGIYQPTPDIKDIALIIDRAKMACSSIKKTYDNIWGYFSEEMEIEQKFRVHIIRTFHDAMREGRIEVYYQPEMRVITRSICGFEALARWRDEEYGMISPGIFVNVLEDAHLSHQLDLYIIKKVCQDLAKVRERLPDYHLRVSVNLSRTDFRFTDMYTAIEDIRSRYNVDRRLLNIEVTESAFTEDEDFLKKEVTRFRNGGYEVWLDDFGSGYSSLHSLKDFVVDVVKIDMSFLRSFEINPKSKIILRAIINMAKELNIQTLTEGVETEEQFKFLQEIGCEKVQGYLFSKPITFEGAIEMCRGDNPPYNLEPFHLGSYYKQIGTINVLSSQPLEETAPPIVGHSTALAIIERQDGKIKYLYRNDAYNDFLSRIGYDGTKESFEHYKGRRHQNELLLSRLMNQSAKTWSEVYNDFITRGVLCRIRLRKMFRDENTNRSVFLVSAMTISRFSAEAGSAQETTHHLLGVYDRVDLFNLSKNSSVPLYISENEMLFHYESATPHEVMASYADNVIILDDREACKDYYSPGALHRVYQNRYKQKSVSRIFHKKGDNSPVMRLHMLVPFHINQDNCIISCIQTLDENCMHTISTDGVHEI